MQVPAEPDVQRYYKSHIRLANRLKWLWARFREYEGTHKRSIFEIEGYVLQVRLACEQYALLLQSACFWSLPGSERKKSTESDAMKILAQVDALHPHVSIVPITEFVVAQEPATFSIAAGWEVNRNLFKNVYERGGNYLHATNKDVDQRVLENYLMNATNLVMQLIFVSWRHAVMLDGLAGQIISQILPDGRHMGFVLQAVDEDASHLRSVLINRTVRA